MNRKKKNENRTKIVFSKKRLRLVLLFLALSVLGFYLSMGLDEKLKYPRQICGFFGIAFLVLTCYHIGKLFTLEIRQELYKRVSSAIFNFLSKIKDVTEKIKKKLGIKSLNGLYSRDEMRIIINDDRVRAKKEKPITKKRFSALENDAQRLRYIYVKFIGWKDKKLEKCHNYNTPRELETVTAANEKEHELFDLYCPVRYGEAPKITPEQLKSQYDYMVKNIKKFK